MLDFDNIVGYDRIDVASIALAHKTSKENSNYFSFIPNVVNFCDYVQIAKRLMRKRVYNFITVSIGTIIIDNPATATRTKK